MSATNTLSGIFTAGVNNGFRFTVPADTEQKTLKVYLGLWRAQGRFEAILSDGSAASYVDTSLSNSTGTSNGVYTVNFRAAGAGQSLLIRYTDINDFVSGGNVTLQGATLVYSPPAITSLSTNSAPIGTSITIDGSNFGVTQGTGAVTFNGVNATPTSWTSTAIVVPVPGGASSGSVIVTARGVASNTASFTVSPGITNLSASNGAVGDTITINGTTFGNTQGTSTVTFNGTTATPTNWASNSITVTVPTGSTTGPVVVAVAGFASNGVNFTVLPKIDNLAPSSGRVGDVITINGSSFGATQGSSSVTFNGTAASPTNWSANSIVVPVPAGAVTGPVVVTVNGSASNGSAFTIGPKINSVAPGIASIGTSVVITGTTFGANQGASTVTFNGTSATPTAWSDTSITVPVPAGSTSGPIVVTVGGLQSNGFAFSVAPHINTLTPAAGGVGDSITVSGTNFGATQGTSTISFNGTTATPSTWNDTSIVTTVPTDATTGSVVVTVAGESSSGVNFTVVPRITGVDPGAGSAGEAVTINGTTFGSTQGGSTVTFNGAAANPTSWSSTSISVPVPVAATTGPIVVTVNGSASNGLAFNVTTTGGLSGKITVAGSSAPVPGAVVKAIQGNTVVATATANGVGDYVFSSLTVGTYLVEASAAGYGTKRKNLVNVVAGAITVNIALNAIVTGPVSYIYDNRGRLVTVVGPTDTINYSYDQVGNLLSISLQSSSQISIVNFTPAGGPTETSVTINGTGFSPTPSQNTVEFNGTAASVTSSTATRVVAVVPAGATTGTISVTSPAGTATSANPFTVGQPAGAPTVSSFSPIVGVSGTAVTISGTNFQSVPGDNTVKFSNVHAPITSSDATTIVTSSSSNVSGKISVTTPYGTVLAPGDFFVPPPPFTAANVESTARMTIGSSATPGITVAGKIAMVIFDGTAGQRLSIDVGPGTNSYNYVDFYRPDGLKLIDSLILVPWANRKFVEPLSLPATGSYTIVVRGDGTTTGVTPISLYEVPPDISGTITVGAAPLAVTNTTPGQNASFTLAGSQGQEISFQTSGSTITGLATIKKPDGTNLASAYYHQPGQGPEAYIDKQILQVTGTYTVFIDPGAAATGTTNIRLHDASDITGTITPDGSLTPVTISTPGKNALLTFAGSVDQRISLRVTSSNIAYDVYIKEPDGTVIAQKFINSGWTGDFFDTLTLDTAGTYTILVDPGGSFTGTVNLRLYDVPPDFSGTISIGGAAVPVAMSVPGQNGTLTFDGTQGQQLTVRLTGSTYGCVSVSLVDPGGATLTSAGPCLTTFNLPTQTLPSTGTYLIKIDPSTYATGSINVSVTNP